MASSSSGNSLPAPEAVQVLVSLLADDSSIVREASMSSLNDIASLNPLLVLDCCAAVSRGGRRRFGNMAGLFQVMAFAVKALDEKDVDATFMSKLVKIATSEMISSKELNADWQRAASRLLVSIGSHIPDLMMEEIFVHLSGSSSALPAMIQILADFASVDALQFTPRLKAVLSRVLPILGSVRDVHRPIFANAFKCWCQATSLYHTEFPSHEVLDADVMSFLDSAFELLLRVWATSRDLKAGAVCTIRQRCRQARERVPELDGIDSYCSEVLSRVGLSDPEAPYSSRRPYPQLASTLTPRRPHGRSRSHGAHGSPSSSILTSPTVTPTSAASPSTPLESLHFTPPPQPTRRLTPPHPSLATYRRQPRPTPSTSTPSTIQTLTPIQEAGESSSGAKKPRQD